MFWNYLQNYTVRSPGWRGTSETATGRAMAAPSPALLSGSFILQSDIHTSVNLVKSTRKLEKVYCSKELTKLAELVMKCTNYRILNENFCEHIFPRNSLDILCNFSYSAE
jgi:hypothetical protein